MEKKEKFSLSRLLFRFGKKIRFRPAREFVTLREEDADRKGSSRPVGSPKRLRLKNAAARIWEQSFFVRCAERVRAWFFRGRVRSWGVSFFLCGLVNALSFFTDSLLFLPSGDDRNFLMGIVFIFLSLPLLLDRGTVREALLKSFLFRRPLRRGFGLDRREIPDGEPEESLWQMVLVGLVFGLFSVFATPAKALAVLFEILLAWTVFIKPETGLVAYGAAFFFVSDAVLLRLLLVTLISFFLKCCIGKRSLSFRWKDAVLFLCFAAILFTELFRGAAGDRQKAFLLFGAWLLYFLSSHLVNTLDWLRRFCASLSYSLAAATVLRLLFFFLTAYSPLLAERCSGMKTLFLFSSSADAAVVSVVLFPLFLTSCRISERRFTRLLPFPISAAMLVLLFSEKDALLWIAFFAGLCAVTVFSRPGALYGCLAGGIVLGILSFILPEEILASIRLFFGFDQLPLSPFFHGSAVERFQNALPWGLGAANGGEAESGNLFLQAGTLFGVLGLAVLAGILIFFVWQSLRFARETTSPAIHTLILGVLCGFGVLLLYGFFREAAAFRLVLLLLLFPSLPRAARRACRKEEILLPY